ncbi:MAG TPA: bestrophin family ion channel [Cyclobacteriaceae bacterium]|nr:bestrophin family ion channel [Cyclobacteriaceae bacterium]
MVNYNPKVWLDLIFHSYSKQVMKTLLPALLFIGLFTAAVCYVFLEHIEPNQFPSSTAVHSLLGIVLGLFLVFRTNSAYDRWWEGRRLWGGLLNSARNFALKLNSILPVEQLADRRWFAGMIGNFAFATKEHLRKGVDLRELEINDDAFRAQLTNAAHKPNFIAAVLYNKVEVLFKANVITGFHLTNLDKELKDFIDLLGACERIKKTPIPYSYTMYIKKFIFIYIITLPFGFLNTFGYYTIPTVLLVSFILLSVELIAEEIEDPFGRDINDLPTDELCETIKANVWEILTPR